MHRFSLPLAVLMIIVALLPAENARIDVLMLGLGGSLLALYFASKNWANARVALFGSIWTALLSLLPIQNLVSGEASVIYNCAAFGVLVFSAVMQFQWHKKLSAESRG